MYYVKNTNYQIYDINQNIFKKNPYRIPRCGPSSGSADISCSGSRLPEIVLAPCGRCPLFSRVPPTASLLFSSSSLVLLSTSPFSQSKVSAMSVKIVNCELKFSVSLLFKAFSLSSGSSSSYGSKILSRVTSCSVCFLCKGFFFEEAWSLWCKSCLCFDTPSLD